MDPVERDKLWKWWRHCKRLPMSCLSSPAQSVALTEGRSPRLPGSNNSGFLPGATEEARCIGCDPCCQSPVETREGSPRADAICLWRNSPSKCLVRRLRVTEAPSPTHPAGLAAERGPALVIISPQELLPLRNGWNLSSGLVEGTAAPLLPNSLPARPPSLCPHCLLLV